MMYLMEDLNEFDIEADLAKIESDSKEQVKTRADKIIDEAEQEFKQGGNETTISRIKEEAELKKKMALLQVQLSKHRNVRNHRLRTINSSLAEKRMAIRRQIEEIKLRLDEIKVESKPV